jgi:putative transposase
VRVYRFIEAEKAEYSVSLMTRVLGVSRSGYYAWRDGGPSSREMADIELTERIGLVHASSRGTYGYPRVHAELRGREPVGRNRIARLMRRAGLSGCCATRRTYTTRRDKDATPAADLVERRFLADAPDRLWLADITYVPTLEGRLYLAFVLDAYSRKVVGWSMAEHIRAELVVDALTMAVASRKPAEGLVHHSDHGSQYTSLEFGRTLKQAGILPSMGSVGDAYDNAMAESFVSTLKRELIHRNVWPTWGAVRLAIFEYIEVFYDRSRLHSAIGYLSPAQFERGGTMTHAAA